MAKRSKSLVKKKVVVKPWTKPHKINYAKQILRRSCNKTRAHNEALSRAKYYEKMVRKDGTYGDKVLLFFTCEVCGNRGLKRKEVEVDHIVPIGLAENMEDWVDRLYCTSEELRVTCKPCHVRKSTEDKLLIKENKSDILNNEDHNGNQPSVKRRSKSDTVCDKA